MERNRTGDQSQFEIAFPVGTHNQLLWFSVYVCAAICRGKDAVFISEAFIPRAGCEPLAEERVDYRAVYRGFAHNFLAVSPTYGRFLYAIARACKATRIVEFGTSMGISTIYLAAALRDNGGGHLISSELEPAKVARARANLDAAGLGDLVDIREDDALDTLKDVPTSSGKSSGMKICEKHSYSRWSWPGACWNRSTVSAAARSIPCTRIYASASA